MAKATRIPHNRSARSGQAVREHGGRVARGTSPIRSDPAGSEGTSLESDDQPGSAGVTSDGDAALVDRDSPIPRRVSTLVPPPSHSPSAPPGPSGDRVAS